MLAGLIAGIGSLIGGAATGAVSLGSSILGGIGSAAGAVGSAGAGLAGAGLKAAGGLASAGGQVISGAVGTAGKVGGSIVGAGSQLADVLGSEQVQRAVGTAGGIYSLFNPPEAPDIIMPSSGVVAQAGDRAPIGSTLANILPGIAGASAPAQSRVFTTAQTTPPSKPSYTMDIVFLLMIAVLFFISKKKK